MDAPRHKYEGMSIFSYILNKLVDHDGVLTSSELSADPPPHMNPKSPSTRIGELVQMGVVTREPMRAGPGHQYRYELVDLGKMPEKWRDEFTPKSPKKGNTVEKITPPPADDQLSAAQASLDAARGTAAVNTSLGIGQLRLVVEVHGVQHLLTMDEARALYDQLRQVF